MAYPLPAEVGEVIGSFSLDAVLSQGGMGCVYRATHTKLGRTVALKVLRTDLTQDHDFVGRLFREARIANAISSPHVVDIFDVVETNDRLALVMELIHGPTLADHLSCGPLSVKEACTILLQIIDGLEAVHDAGFIHRDLKPSNIILEEDGDDYRVKILDFGIGKAPEGVDEVRTMAGMMLGTPTYMAPEQVAAMPVSAASDVFALGAIFYELLTKRHAYEGRRIDILRNKVHGRLPPLLLPVGLTDAAAIRTLVRQCLSANPTQRPTLEQVRTRIRVLGERAMGSECSESVDRTRWIRRREIETVVAGPDTVVDLGVSPPPVHDIDRITIELMGDEDDPDLFGGANDDGEVVVPFWEPDLLDRTAAAEAPSVHLVAPRAPRVGTLILMGGLVGALAQLGLGFLV